MTDIISGEEALKITETMELVSGRPQYAADLRKMEVSTATAHHYKAYPVRGDGDAKKAKFDQMVNTIKAAAERENVEVEIRTNPPRTLLYVRRLT